MISSVLGFNLGIEAVQLMVIMAAMPWLLLLARSRVYEPLRITGAMLTGIAAGAWLAERAFGWVNPIVPLVETVASHALSLLAGLVVLSVAVTVADYDRNSRRLSRQIRRAGETDAAV